MEFNDGILIQDIDADVEHTDTEDTQSLDKKVSFERVEGDSSDSKRLLRDQLRRSLSQRAIDGELYAEHWLPTIVMINGRSRNFSCALAR